MTERISSADNSIRPLLFPDPLEIAKQFNDMFPAYAGLLEADTINDGEPDQLDDESGE